MKSTNTMCLGIFQDGPVAFDGSRYWQQKPMTTYIKSLCLQFDQTHLYAPFITQKDVLYNSFREEKLESTSIQIHPLSLGGKNPVTAFLRQVKLIPYFYKYLSQYDFLLFFLPATFAIPAILVRRVTGKPYAIYLGSDWQQITSFSCRWSNFLQSLFYHLFFKLGHFLHNRFLHDASFVLTAGEDLRQKATCLGAFAINTVPRMTLKKQDVYIRQDTCSGKTTTCLFVGSLIKRKGLIYLLKAVKILINKDYPLILHIIGDGEMKQQLCEVIKEFGLLNTISISGHIAGGPHLWREYRSADLFILPSLSEGFPRVLYEAMSSSLPIITTNVGGIPYKLKHNQSAVLVPPRNSIALANAIHYLIKNPSLRQRLILNAREQVLPILEMDPGLQLKELISKMV